MAGSGLLWVGCRALSVDGCLGSFRGIGSWSEGLRGSGDPGKSSEARLDMKIGLWPDFVIAPVTLRRPGSWVEKVGKYCAFVLGEKSICK